MDSDTFDKSIRGKSINFLIGSGASVGIYPTLSFGKALPSFEEVLINPILSDESKSILYIYYFVHWILPMSKIGDQFYEEYKDSPTYHNYSRFINAMYAFLQNESNELPKRINIFTTNYDLLFEHAFDEFLVHNPLIYFNDGSRGVFRRYISNANYYLNVSHSGYNDNYRREVPTINLFKMHGSISWEYEDNTILVQENNSLILELKRLEENLCAKHTEIETIIDKSKSESSCDFARRLNSYACQEAFDRSLVSSFMKAYRNLPIINPNKYKFYKTVSEQAYYQMIRSFSYELEKQQSVLIVFGFSFADEHITEIFQRSLLNPELQVFIVCYSKNEQIRLQKKFEGYRNIMFLPDFENDSDNKDIKGDFNYLLSLFGFETVEAEGGK